MLNIAGHKVYCDSDREYYGLKHLRYKLSDDEVEALFDQAERKREVAFEDDGHRRFSLIDGENGSFTVVRNER